MKTRLKRLPVAILISLILCLGSLWIESQTKVIQRAYDNWVLDNRNHYLPCEQWPAEEEVRKVVEEHQALIHQIEGVNLGLAGVEIDPSVCPGRADLVIWYGSHADRVAIEKIIGAGTFYGVPYRLQNR